ncbi:MAG: hypothetical protein V4649_08845 [Bacteroidota bacterium]
MREINTAEDYELALAKVEVYLAKGFEYLTPEEDEELSVISKAVQKYERVEFPMPVREDQVKPAD